MTRLLGFIFDNTLGKLAAAAAGLLALVSLFAWEQRTIGGERATRKIEQTTKARGDIGAAAVGESKAASDAASGGAPAAPAVGGWLRKSPVERGERLRYRD